MTRLFGIDGCKGGWVVAAWVMPSFHEEMEKHRIYSMTMRPDNDYLWQHYAGGNTGYCLEFESAGVFSHARTVLYGDEVQIDFCRPETIDAIFLFRKTRRYESEEEVRILLFPRGQPHDVPFAPALLRRVILGNRMAPDHRLVIREWCSVREPAVPVVEEEVVRIKSSISRSLRMISTGALGLPDGLSLLHRATASQR